MKFQPKKIRLALKRLEKDMRDDWFPDPVRFSDRFREAESGANYLTSLSSDMEHDDVSIYDIPKAGFTLRHGVETSFEERLQYQLLTEEIAPDIDQQISESAYAFRLNSANNEYLFQRSVGSWRDWIESSREAVLDAGFLVKADIQNYFESIEHPRLVEEIDSRLNRRKAKDALAELKSLWGRWGKACSGRGIPQNRDASSFFGNAFLMPVDSAMSGYGPNYTRFMDDIVIAVGSESEARESLQRLVLALRRYGLTVNSRKTVILNASNEESLNEWLPEPDIEIEANDRLLNGVLADQERACIQLCDMAQSSISDLMAERKLSQQQERRLSYSMNRLEQASRVPFLNNRLADLSESFVDVLEQHPWKTGSICQFLQSNGPKGNALERLSRKLLDESEFLYDWQQYHILATLGLHGEKCDSVLSWCRETIQTGRESLALVSALVYGGKFGDGHVRRSAANQFRHAKSALVRRAVLIASQEASQQTREQLLVPHMSQSDLQTCEVWNELGEAIYYAPPSQIAPHRLLDEASPSYGLAR